MHEPNFLLGRKKSLIDPNADNGTFSENTQYTQQDLVPHLERTSLLITPPKSHRKIHLLVTCKLTLDLWTSEPGLEPDISLSVPLSNGAKIEQEVKKVFKSILKGGATGTTAENGDIDSDASSLVRAVYGVIGVLFEDE